MKLLTDKQMEVLEIVREKEGLTTDELAVAMNKRAGKNYSTPYYYTHVKLLVNLGVIQQEDKQPRKIILNPVIKDTIINYLDAYRKFKKALFPNETSQEVKK